jgi:ADP-ribosylation factor protein 1
MGLLFSKFYKFINYSKEPVRMIMLGLDSAGKTTILYNLKLGEIVTTIPTIGFNVETVKYKNFDLVIWDIGGQDKIRKLWNYYYTGAKGLIFVVDSSDYNRLEEARDVLLDILNNDILNGIPILVYANKQDQTNALEPVVIAEKLGLITIKSHPWFVQGSCATSGDGLVEGLDWFASQLS